MALLSASPLRLVVAITEIAAERGSRERPTSSAVVAGLIVFTVAVLAPLVAAALLVALAAAILAMPYLLVRSIRSVRARRTAPAPASVASRSLG